MRYVFILILGLVANIASAQQVNPVPDYTFANRMSAGRNTVTDTAAYFSIGPRYGAIRGMMPPMVVDTASVSGNKRNGLLIFSVQKNKFVYWDSVGSKWAEMAGTGGTAINSGDTASMLLPYLRKADTTAMLTKYLRRSDTATLSNRINLKVNISDTASMLAPYLKESDTVFLSNRVNLKVNISDTATMLAPYLKESDTVFLSNRINLKVNISDTSSMLTNYVRHAGYGLTKSGQAFLVDTAAMATRARVQKGIDSVASIAGSGFTGSGTTNYVAKFTGTKALGNSIMYESGASVGIGTTSPIAASGYGALTIRSGGSGSILQLADGTIDYRLQLVNNDAVVRLGTYSNTGIDIITNSNQSHRFHSSGNFSIGNLVDAGYKTDIAGNLRVIGNAATTSGLIVQNSNGASGTAQHYLDFGTSSTLISRIYRGNGASGVVGNGLNIDNFEGFQVRANQLGGSGGSINLLGGSVGIGTSSPSYTTDIAGTLRSTLGANFATTSGNVGIGTASPSTILHLQGTSPVLTVRNNITASATQDSANNKTAGSLTFGANGSFEVVASIEGKYQSDASFGRRADLLFSTRSVENALTEKARLTSAGELLIGTTSDAGAYALQVAGSIYNTTGAVLAANSGNVGIGINPTQKLEVIGNIQMSGTSWFRYLDGGGYFGSATVTSNGYARETAIRADSTLIFSSGGSTERMRISADGEVRIGNNPADAGDYKLQVNGNERIAGKLDVITTTEYGVNLGRSGTSATAFQAYNSTAAMAVGIESSTGGGLFTGTSAYAAVFGNANNYPTQFVTNNTVKATITASGNLLIGTATDNGLGYKLQVNGGIYANSTIQAKAAQVSIDSVNNLAALYISQHTITGSSTQPMMQSDVTLNTTGDVNLVNYTITNTASGANTNWLRFTDGSNTFRVTKAAEVVTAAPTGGSVRKWKLGEAATVSPTSPNRTIRVEIDGTVYYLHAKTTND